MEVRKDFPMLKKDLIYFDNSATTFKPYSVIEAVVDYYSNYTANAHRGDYDISLKVDDLLEGTREKVRSFIKASSFKEIIFTSGTTASFNMIVNDFFKYYLKSKDEILITKSEHASLVLPWFLLEEKIGCKVKYIPLDEDLKVTLDNVKKVIGKNTKVISLSYLTNVIGDIRPIKEITEYAHKRGIYVVIDGAQAVPHLPIDVQSLDIDFLTFSAHKMLGPTGVGVLYGKEKWLKQIKPSIVGGGMNDDFTSLKEVKFKDLPHCLEAGTPNIAGILGFGKAIDYLNIIGMENVFKHDQMLKRYALEKLSKLKNIKIYNPKTETGIITFNVTGIFSQDTAIYLNKNKVCLRAGAHCARMLSEDLNVTSTCRISFYLYNTKEEIDKLASLLSEEDILKKSL
ncbi:MAG: aminotransferase class V-fold PLP-dependent enzyme [Bacilli bacterium]